MGRPVRALPGRDRPPGGDPGPPRRRPAQRLGRAGGGAPPGSRTGHARRLDLRSRPDREPGGREGSSARGGDVGVTEPVHSAVALPPLSPIFTTPPARATWTP